MTQNLTHPESLADEAIQESSLFPLELEAGDLNKLRFELKDHEIQAAQFVLPISSSDPIQENRLTPPAELARGVYAVVRSSEFGVSLFILGPHGEHEVARDIRLRPDAINEFVRNVDKMISDGVDARTISARYNPEKGTNQLFYRDHSGQEQPIIDVPPFSATPEERDLLQKASIRVGPDNLGHIVGGLPDSERRFVPYAALLEPVLKNHLVQGDFGPVRGQPYTPERVRHEILRGLESALEELEKTQSGGSKTALQYRTLKSELEQGGMSTLISNLTDSLNRRLKDSEPAVAAILNSGAGHLTAPLVNRIRHALGAPEISFEDLPKSVTDVWLDPATTFQRTSRYGSRFDHHHNGVDYAGYAWQPFSAPGAGKIGPGGFDPRVFGEHGVTLEHRDNAVTRFGHNNASLLEESRINRKGLHPVDRKNLWVLPGEMILLMGSWGLSTGPHVHFEFRENGREVDPEQAIQKRRGV